MHTPFSFQLKTFFAAVFGVALFLSSLLPSPAFAQSAPQGGQPGGLSGAAAGAAGGVATCSLSAIFNNAIGGGINTLLNGANAILSVPTNDLTNNQIQGANANRDDVMSCLARAVARSLLDNMTSSVVNWINSGFNGQPSFVSNYDQFFGNVADDAAGNFIQGSDLAFLCSPFALDVKIAVARAYAMQTDAPQCSLSSITSNIEGFMNNFDQGGWPAYLAFTSAPSNNPFGAYVGAEASFQSSLVNAQAKKGLDLSLGSGFLSYQEEQNCHVYLAAETPSVGPNQKETVINDGHQNKVCDLVNVTPGTAIDHALDNQFQANVSSLVNAKYFDEIISALVSQLIQQTLYAGLSNLSSDGGYQNYTPPQAVSDAGAGSLTQSLAASVGSSIVLQQQIITIENQNIASIKSAESSLTPLAACWNSVASSNSATSDQKTQALGRVSSTTATVTALDAQMAQYQTILTHASSTLLQLQGLVQQAQNSGDTLTLQGITQQFIALNQSGQLATPGNVSAASQDQAQLSGALSQIQSNQVVSMSQCQSVQSQLAAQAGQSSSEPLNGDQSGPH